VFASSFLAGAGRQIVYGTGLALNYEIGLEPVICDLEIIAIANGTCGGFDFIWLKHFK
jgi:hypothetical protein